MNEKDIMLLKEYLNNGLVETEELNKLIDKIDLIVEQIELNKKYQEDLEEINSKLVELNK